MKNNSLDIDLYLFEAPLLAFMVFCIYKTLLFMPLPGKTAFSSTLILISIIVIKLILCIFVTYRWRRTEGSLHSSVFSSIGIYTFFAYKKYIPSFLWILIVFVAVGVLIGLVLIIKTKGKTPKIRTCRRLRRFFLSIRGAFFAASISLIAVVFIRLFIFDALVLPTKSTLSIKDGGYSITIDNYIDTVLMLQPEKWKTLSNTEKLNVLSCIAQIEHDYLSLDKEIKLYAKQLDKNILGCYSDAKSTIWISVNSLETDEPEVVLETLTHEMFHAAQHHLVRIIDKLESDTDKKSFYLSYGLIFKEEFEAGQKKIENFSDYCEYWGKYSESTARTYSRECVEIYYKHINDYLEKNASQ